MKISELLTALRLIDLSQVDPKLEYQDGSPLDWCCYHPGTNRLAFGPQDEKPNELAPGWIYIKECK